VSLVSNLTLVFAVLAVVWLMALAGVDKGALELRSRRRVCPSCGREIRSRTCARCTA